MLLASHILMALTYTVLTIGQSKLHQLHTPTGKFFVMGEVAMQLFQETPTSFLQELRKGKYNKASSSSSDVLQAIVDLGLQVEGTAAHAGIVLLPAATVEQLLLDKRRGDLVHPFKLAMLKLASQDAARMMASGDYEGALPVALEAVVLGEQLFKPQPALQLFPLYLLAAQANLGLRRAPQCGKCLALANMLAMKEPTLTTNIMRSQLSRLYGQLYAFQEKGQDALRAFAEDVYYCSLEYGPEDARTSLGYYNLSKVLESTGDMQGAMSCADMVVSIWSSCLQRCVLGLMEDGQPVSAGAPTDLPVGRLQLFEVVGMLQDICKLRSDVLGSQHPDVAASHTAAGLALIELGETERAVQALQTAKGLLQRDARQEQQLKLVEQAERQVSTGGSSL